MTPMMKNPRVLFVTPEVAYLPHGMGNIANYLGAKAGGLADVSAALISALFRQGADVHVAIPEYRALYNLRLPHSLQRGIRSIKTMLPEERIHLARDRSFFYLNRKFVAGWEGIRRRQRQFERHNGRRPINSAIFNHLTSIKELRHG